MKYRSISVALLSLVLVSCSPESDDASTTYFIDAHTQMPPGVSETDILTRMLENGVRLSQLAARGGTTGDTITGFASSHPDQIRAMIKVKGSDYNNDTDAYYTRLASQGASSSWQGIGEVLVYHAPKRGGIAPEVDVPLTDNRVLAARDVAVSRSWPLIIHIEFAALGALSADRRSSTMADLEAFLTANPGLPVVMIHMAQLESLEVEYLLETYSNIYFMASHTNPATTSVSSEPWTEMFIGSELKEEWKNLMIAYPSRFIFALDNVWPEHWDASFYSSQMGYWRTALLFLPDHVVQAFTHGNAQRLWSLP